MVFALAEPVLARYPVAFDGVLAHLAFRRSGDAARAHRGLPLAQTEGVYQASELLFLAPVVRSTVHCVRSPRWERFEHGTLGDAGAGALARVHARDRLKPTLDAYAVLSARRAYALGRGDVRAVEGLLEGLDAVGKKGSLAEKGEKTPQASRLPSCAPVACLEHGCKPECNARENNYLSQLVLGIPLFRCSLLSRMLELTNYRIMNRRRVIAERCVPCSACSFAPTNGLTGRLRALLCRCFPSAEY